MSGPGNVKFSQDYVVRTPRNRGAYAIHEQDWERIKRMIRSLGSLFRLTHQRFAQFLRALLGVTARYLQPVRQVWSTI